MDDLDARLRELRESGWTQVVVDLGRLSFLDSSGVNLLVRWTNAASADGFSLELLPGSPAVQRVFEVTGLAGTLPFALRSDP